MRNRVKALSSVLLIITILFSYGHQVFGQAKINISVGFGVPEFLNLGLRFQFDQVQIGLSAGTFPVDDESMNSFSGDVRYYFGGLSDFSNRPPWYGKIGLNYLRDETESYIDKYLYLNARLGREFNISDRFGIELEAGAIFELSYERIRKQGAYGGWDLNFSTPVLPSVGIGLFYRF